MFSLFNRWLTCQDTDYNFYSLTETQERSHTLLAMFTLSSPALTNHVAEFSINHKKNAKFKQMFNDNNPA